MWRLTVVRSIASRRGPIAGIVMWLAAASAIGAQPIATSIQMETGLMSFFTGAGRLIEVRVTEVGAWTAESHVQIAVRNAADRIIFRGEGVLKRGQPVRLELPLNMDERRVRLRASIVIEGQLGSSSSPIVVLEDVDAGSFTIGERFTCSVPASREGPVSPFCPGGVVNTVTGG
jgi:hypothetical protein